MITRPGDDGEECSMSRYLYRPRRPLSHHDPGLALLDAVTVAALLGVSGMVLAYLKLVPY